MLKPRDHFPICWRLGVALALLYMTEPLKPPAPSPLGFPLWPLAMTMSMQTLATMAAFSVPSLAPAIARDLQIDGALTGYFVSLVYGVGIVSSLLAADLIHRHGAVRLGQAVLAATLAMLLISASGSLAALALGAVVLGSAYGSTAPVSTHLLVPRTPHRIVNLVLSIRQIGVPLGGMLGALLLPPLALRYGWQGTFLLQALPAFVLLLLLEVPRRSWDSATTAEAVVREGGLRQIASMVSGNGELKRLSVTISSDALGRALATFEPPLRATAPIGASVELAKPPALFVMTSERPTFTQQGARHTGATLTFEEVFA